MSTSQPTSAQIQAALSFAEGLAEQLALYCLVNRVELADYSARNEILKRSPIYNECYSYFKNRY